MEPNPAVLHWRRLRKSPVGTAGALIVALVIMMAIFAPALAPHDPNLQELTLRLKPPFWKEGAVPGYLLGTDVLGRDQLSRLIYGARISVSIGATAVLLAGAIGVTMGLTAGYLGGLVDNLLMRFTDGFIAFPGLLLTILVMGVVGSGVSTLVLVLGLTGWVGYCRVVRGETLALREREFVLAARSLGQTAPRIMLKHLLPNVGASVVVLATLNVAQTILAESGLSYLGIGVPPEVPTWGRMLSEGRQYLAVAPWLSTFPGIAISVTVLGIIFLGDWLRDVLDPRLRR